MIALVHSRYECSGSCRTGKVRPSHGPEGAKTYLLVRNVGRVTLDRPSEVSAH